MPFLSLAGRSAAAYQNVCTSLCCLTISEGPRFCFPRHNSFRINTYKSAHKY